MYIIGLGLGDERDITLRGLEAVKKCSKVFIEAYTSLLSFGLSSNGLSTLVFFFFQLFLFSFFLNFFDFRLGNLGFGYLATGKSLWETNYACR